MGYVLFGDDYAEVVRERRNLPQREKSVSDLMLEQARRRRLAATEKVNNSEGGRSFVRKARAAWADITDEASRKGKMSLIGMGRSMKKGLALVSRKLVG